MTAAPRVVFSVMACPRCRQRYGVTFYDRCWHVWSIGLGQWDVRQSAERPICPAACVRDLEMVIPQATYTDFGHIVNVGAGGAAVYEL